MAFYTFYFTDGTYKTIEHADETTDPSLEASKAYTAGFGTDFYSYSQLIVDFFERHDSKPSVDNLAFAWVNGKWRRSVNYDRVINCHPTPIKGTYKDLWNWLSNLFTKGETYSTVPLIYFDGSETAVEASVPFGIDRGNHFELSNVGNRFDCISKTLPQDCGEPEYKKACAEVIGFTDQKTAIIVFPANTKECPDEMTIQVFCDFELDYLEFSVKAD